MRADYIRSNSLVEFGFLLLKGYAFARKDPYCESISTVTYCPEAVSEKTLEVINLDDFSYTDNIIDIVTKRDYRDFMEKTTMDRIHDAAYKAIGFMYSELFEKGKGEPEGKPGGEEYKLGIKDYVPDERDER